jgi:hypothetical protein
MYYSCMGEEMEQGPANRYFCFSQIGIIPIDIDIHRVDVLQMQRGVGGKPFCSIF